MYPVLHETGFANQDVNINTVYEYDPVTAVWTQKASMPTSRGGFAHTRIRIGRDLLEQQRQGRPLWSAL
jgi:hypothetical protein